MNWVALFGKEQVKKEDVATNCNGFVCYADTLDLAFAQLEPKPTEKEKVACLVDGSPAFLSVLLSEKISRFRTFLVASCTRQPVCLPRKAEEKKFGTRSDQNLERRKREKRKSG